MQTHLFEAKEFLRLNVLQKVMGVVELARR